MIEPIRCSLCGGKGWLANSDDACPECAGEGMVRVYPASVEMVPRATAMLLARDAYQWLVRQRIPEPDSPEQVLQAALEAAEERDGDE